MNAATEQFKLRIQDNGPAELATLFEDNRERLKRMVSGRLDSRLCGRIDASDVVQNTFVKACHELDDYVNESDFSPSIWLRVLNKRSLAETHRHEQAKRRMPDANVNCVSQSVFDAFSQSIDSPSELAARAELYANVSELLDGLPDTDRDVIFIHHIEQRTIEETAAELGISVEGTMKRYVRAIRKLQSRAKAELNKVLS